MWECIFLLLPIAAYSGWCIGKRNTTQQPKFPPTQLSSDYYAGLNFLLNEQTDKAVDAFIKMLEVSSDTVETTLALGNFFRHRGEVSRAIRVHQNLLLNPHLTEIQRAKILLELAQNYMQAGFYDRAELLLLEIIEGKGSNIEISLRPLIDIYERQKDWKKAIKMAIRLEVVSKHSMKREIAHYYCELAEKNWAKGKIRLAFKYLRRGLRYDKNCARASLLRGNFEKKLGRYKQALRAYQCIESQDRAFLPEAIPMVILCYEKLQNKTALNQYLSYLMDQCPSMSIVLANAEQVKEQYGKEKAARFLANYMVHQPSVRGLKHLIEFHLTKVAGELRKEVMILKSLVEQLLEKKPIYRCGHCGFAARLLHWQCPSCRQWAELKPIQGIEGE